MGRSGTPDPLPTFTKIWALKGHNFLFNELAEAVPLKIVSE